MKFLEQWLPLRAGSLLCVLLIAPGDSLLYSQSAPAQAASSASAHEKKLTPEQLDSLVAPIALYPDPLLGQVLAASTYPVQVVEAERWLNKNSNLTGTTLVQAAAEQDWEASVQALVVFPKIVQRMSDNLPWTATLGNAFLAQEQDVMQAVQRMRQTARQSGALQSNSQQKVETKTAEGQHVVMIQPANPQVIFVPSYNPTLVYGAAPVYAPYPAMVYPPAPSTVGIAAASLLAFGTGVSLAAAFSGCCGYGCWGWGCAWGRRPTVILNNNFFSRYGFRRPIVAPNGGWAHDPRFRGPVPYSNAGIARRYGAAGYRPSLPGPAQPADLLPPSGNASAPGPFDGGDRSWRASQAQNWAGSRRFDEPGWSSGGFGDFNRGGAMSRAARDRGFGSMGGFGGRFGSRGGPRRR